jgi:hypothetical protein
MKGIDKGPGYEGKDMTIFYSILSEVPTRIKILNEIREEHPEWIDSFGTPPLMCGTLNGSYYGVCHVGTYSLSKELEEEFGFKVSSGNTFTYNDTMAYISKTAYYSKIAKLVLSSPLRSKVDKDMFKDLQDLADLKNIKRETFKIGNIYNATINERKISSLISYLRENNYTKQLKSLGYSLDGDEWISDLQKRMQLAHNISQGIKLDKKISPAVNEFIIRGIINPDDITPRRVDKPELTSIRKR